MAHAPEPCHRLKPIPHEADASPQCIDVSFSTFSEKVFASILDKYLAAKILSLSTLIAKKRERREDRIGDTEASKMSTTNSDQRGTEWLTPNHRLNHSE